MQYLGYQCDHHPTSSVWMVAVVQFAWDLCKEERVTTTEVHVNVYMLTKIPMTKINTLGTISQMLHSCCGQSGSQYQ